jgi:hypothetical protein
MSKFKEHSCEWKNEEECEEELEEEGVNLEDAESEEYGDD